MRSSHKPILDHVPIQQAEEFFSALRRQRKPAQYVRYAWEGHLLKHGADCSCRFFAR